jgi:SAM-dependent methyltransferase
MRKRRSRVDALYLLRMAVEKGYRHPDQDFISRIKSVASRRPGAVWADLGGGSNFYVHLLRGHFRAAFGIDADPAYLGSRPGPDLLGDILRLPFKTGSVDLLTSFMVIEHIPRPEGFAEEIDRVLAEGGVFLFVTVNRRYWGSRLNAALPESLKTRLLGLLFRREERDIFPAYYRLNTREDIVRAFGGRFALEIKAYRGYYSVNRPLFWLQHALALAFRKSGLFESNLLIMGRRRGGAPEAARPPA